MLRVMMRVADAMRERHYAESAARAMRMSAHVSICYLIFFFCLFFMRMLMLRASCALMLPRCCHIRYAAQFIRCCL